ncbi:hypothetical protein BHE90_017449 [Fusarium euwallaceae]|uniref:Uncharacterized protein n=1 Tax=Fusarium euwallaceae TaxID=1147111 RepID=A0A430KXU6_9HYPO|nr:hypothetical protein BHE90_017449 [Fusarium euwallaceae]
MDFYRALWPTLEFDKDIHDSSNPNPTCIIDRLAVLQIQLYFTNRLAFTSCFSPIALDTSSALRLRLLYTNTYVSG